jgi:5-methylcytosine-specific restriction endonuclease McrA
MAWAFRGNGSHVRNHDHVDRYLHQRILLAHTGTCSVCHRDLAHGEEVFWNPEAHVTICVTCNDDVVV